MKLFLKVWRQDSRSDEGRFETHTLDDVSEDSSFRNDGPVNGNFWKRNCR